MKIAIIGYGKMGKEIESIAQERGIVIKSIIDPKNPEVMYREINEESLKDVDVAIDFTHPDAVMKNMRTVSSLGKNLVIGTTGWYDRMNEVKDVIERSGTGAIWSGNFSLGVNIFFKLIEYSAKIMNNFSEYDVLVHEMHHQEKADSPSGTASMIGDIILKNSNEKDEVVTGNIQRKIKDNELQISSSRLGSVPGTHAVIYDSPVDTIELKHTVRTRRGLALGAVYAAEWICEKVGFFGIEDMMNEIITYGE